METGNEMENEYIDATSTAKMSPTTAYITLANNDLLKKKTNDIIRSIAMENPEEVHPLYAFRNREFIRLIFPSNQARNNAVEQKLSIFGLRVALELPRQPMKKTTIHVYNLPIEEKSSDVEKWLKGLGFTVMTEMRWTCYQNTNIRNGGRSYVISAPEDKEIPGYAQFRSVVQGKTIWGQIWYYLMPEWCRRCKEKHERENCPKADGNHGMESNSYAAKAAGGYGGFRSHLGARGNQDEMMAKVARGQEINVRLEEPEMMALSADQVIVRSSAPKQASASSTSELTDQVFKPPNDTTSGQAKDSEEYVYFSLKSQETAFLSNSYPCSLNIDEMTYFSVSHYFNYRRALKVGDKKMAKKIKNAKSNDQALDIHIIEWNEETNGNLNTFRSEIYYEANKEKYKGNGQLRKMLFETAPRKLVLANEDPIWGTGLELKDPDNGDCSKWKGTNLTGKILTEIRDTMMASGEYVDELTEYRQTLSDSNSENRKRGRESTDSDISREGGSPSNHQNKQLRAESLDNDLTIM